MPGIHESESNKAKHLRMDRLSVPTYNSLQDWSDVTQSAGFISGGAITDAGSGQINVAAGTGIIKTSDSTTGNNVFFDWSASSGVSLTDDSTNWVYVDYNGGSPTVAVILALGILICTRKYFGGSRKGYRRKFRRTPKATCAWKTKANFFIWF